MTNLVTAKELCKLLKLTDTTIYKLAAQGDLPGFKIGDSWRFDMDEAPASGSKLDTDYIMGMAKMNGRVKILLDIKKIFSTDEINFSERAA